MYTRPSEQLGLYIWPHMWESFRSPPARSGERAGQGTMERSAGRAWFRMLLRHVMLYMGQGENGMGRGRRGLAEVGEAEIPQEKPHSHGAFLQTRVRR
jgi:hypothetical protein